ncbi:hypothetical protein SARC_02748 [Sphaeroforma arctica JP610]|uniref:Antistasin-like domain-containing protein n=1 Tax=Sphaeroforma arctica JP610 TaxID=667725 RepID=A0A0L0G7T3_9EUKA|nr:hypothetical protein SARC_02748 [Sphaeroforma arctica JP610]KNC85055.1 hypothetical protein SARC_02748 [Sphaeroforma arctica JP610]|eukprot:XP_014158957.1 hypothetical protein SARC_02748 [Sphaeroforma arctica JP610]
MIIHATFMQVVLVAVLFIARTHAALCSEVQNNDSYTCDITHEFNPAASGNEVDSPASYNSVCCKLDGCKKSTDGVILTVYRSCPSGNSTTIGGLQCPQLSCDAGLTCPCGRVKDDSDCDTCECLSDPNSCGPEPVCTELCWLGSVPDERGCPTCNCRTEFCPFICAIACEYGNVKDANGCDMCACIEDNPCDEPNVCPTGVACEVDISNGRAKCLCG